jgi:formylglycine-generating enzyme required for sulfatase activity
MYVTWFGAHDYAERVGKRLSIEEEWEKETRGTDGWKCPCVSEWKEGMCNSIESGTGMTGPVDQFRSGKSIFGCHAMAGNVWEWTGSKYDHVFANNTGSIN